MEDENERGSNSQQPLIKENKRLKEDLINEKLDRQRLLSQKNQEVAYFKSELSHLMTDMQRMVK